ncbi:nucleotide disphospho-sugar-binding domain-containing protein [Sorangium sp. So ce1024]|uniref:nucleotide disphospho-sugar-binding domain-containing protein n=1 Tax=Sorangium sp. So ce1024 TaxID=3133327 RepID=UPI003F0E5243
MSTTGSPTTPAAGRRVVLSLGWAELGLVHHAPDGIAIGDVNQQALFPRLVAVVHHGGAGTTTTAARAGVPLVIIPTSVSPPTSSSEPPCEPRRVAAFGSWARETGDRWLG